MPGIPAHRVAPAKEVQHTGFNTQSSQQTYFHCGPLYHQVYLLQCRAGFKGDETFERVLPVLNVVLASLHPLTDEQLFRALNAGGVRGEMSWEDFQQRLETLACVLVRREPVKDY